jgi:hypothetical protein
MTTETLKTPSQKEFRRSLREVIAYLFEDECDDYYQSGQPPSHIFLHVCVLREWLKADNAVMVDRAELRRLCDVADYATVIEAADADDANGEEDWSSVYDDAREAGLRLADIRRTLSDILHVATVENVAAK